MGKELNWGETPWDNLPKEELLREVQRMFFALQSADDVLRVFQRQDHPFWEKSGRGGRALDRAAQVIEPVYEAYDQEDVYRSFYRYAVSLLFEVPDYERWIVCSECGDMQSGGLAASYVGSVCKDAFRRGECQGIMRWLEWKDLAPSTDEK